MRLIEKLGYLVRARFRGLSHGGHQESLTGNDKELEGMRSALEIAERRRQSVESELTANIAEGYSAHTARLERQLVELERSENQLRNAVALIEATSALVKEKGEGSPMTPSPLYAANPKDEGKVELVVEGSERGDGNGESSDLTDRKTRLSDPRKK